MLQPIFKELLQAYTNDSGCIETLWQELLEKYSAKRRYYHNLTHLEHMYRELLPVQQQIQDWNMVLVALFYHDAVYNPLRRDNEAKSAKLVMVRLRDLLSSNQKLKCLFLIGATTDHVESEFSDVNFFIDADLAIFGQAWDTYAAYAKNIRSEYSVYPDFLYNKGRKSALQHFLQLERIFKTQPFFERYEQQARRNLALELAQLKA